jgi:hypothetical protein
LNDCNLSIHNHVFGVKCAEDRSVVVDNLQIHIRYLLRTRQLNLAGGVIWRKHWLVVVDHLGHVRKMCLCHKYESS